MESFLDDDSPLANILQGEGLSDGHAGDNVPNNTNTDHFAPSSRAHSGLQARLKQRIGQPLKIDISKEAILQNLSQKCTDVIGSNIHAADSERFLEQFRYTLIASNLLAVPGALPTNEPSFQGTAHISSTHHSSQETWSAQGVISAVGLPASIAGLARWTYAARTWGALSARSAVTTIFLLLIYLAVTSYVKRQQLGVIRKRAVVGATSMTANLKALEQSSNAALTLVKEVELVSRGYMLRSPQLPPISMLENSDSKVQNRRCARLRRILLQLYLESIPRLIEDCKSLSAAAIPDDLEKYLDVYEVAPPDIQEAFSGALVTEIDDQESLSALRAMQWRFETLRKALLCHLLALPASGVQSEGRFWRNAVRVMEQVCFKSGQWAEKLNDILREDEQPLSLPSPTTNRNSAERERSRQQLRKLNELSSELRAMQAKLHILRDDIHTALDGSSNSTSVINLFVVASESLGQDIRTLNSTFESWKTSLLPPASRRHSRASSELRSPISLGGLTAVDESCAMDGPHEALLALNGLTPLNGSTAGSDEEVFEAVALPRVRRVLTREEKMAKLQDDEARRASVRELRMQGVSMVKELETVMHSRMSKRMSTGRIPVSPRVSSI